MRVALSGADYFHHLVHRLILRRGGPGNCGQLRVRLDRAPDPAAVAQAWHLAGQHAWPLGGRFRAGLRGAWFSVRAPADLALDHGDRLDALADAHLRAGLDECGPRARLGRAGDARDPGLVLTWDHRLCDARGAMGLLAALPGLDATRPAAWLPARREAGIPAGWGARGRLARAALAHLGARGRDDLWRPPVAPASDHAAQAAPLAHAGTVLDPAATARLAQRQRAATGRLGETAFLIAALAAALDDLGGIGRDLLFPLAADARGPEDGGGPGDRSGFARLLENRHGFVFLRLPAGLASRDLVAAARHLARAWRAWLADGADVKLAAALSFFPLVGERLARAEIGGGCPGLAASCLVANTGQTRIPATLFGAGVIGVDHRVAVPAQPGLAVLFHRDARGLGWDVIATGAVAAALPQAALAGRLRHHLLDRALALPADDARPTRQPAAALAGAAPP
jgi:hypothetical protein